MGYPQIIHLNRIFQYKASILGTPILGTPHTNPLSPKKDLPRKVLIISLFDAFFGGQIHHLFGPWRNQKCLAEMERSKCGAIVQLVLAVSSWHLRIDGHMWPHTQTVLHETRIGQQLRAPASPFRNGGHMKIFRKHGEESIKCWVACSLLLSSPRALEILIKAVIWSGDNFLGAAVATFQKVMAHQFTNHPKKHQKNAKKCN